jgi:branched-chain amino acid transport system substrate-binding protein
LPVAAARTAIALALPAAAEIRIAPVNDKTGALETSARQSHDGLMPGLEQATGSRMESNGGTIVAIETDSRLNPDMGKALLSEAPGDDDAHRAVGPTGPGTARAMPPVAAEYERGLIVEPAVACSITGAAWNRCIVRTGRTASRDAISKATGPGREGVKIATPASDHAFGRDGIPAFRETPAGTPPDRARGLRPSGTTEFTARAERIVNAMKDVEGEKARSSSGPAATTRREVPGG